MNRAYFTNPSDLSSFTVPDVSANLIFFVFRPNESTYMFFFTKIYHPLIVDGQFNESLDILKNPT